MQIPDINQIPGTALPLIAGDEVLVIRKGQVVKVKFAAVCDIGANNGATEAGLALLTAADLEAQKTILGIGA
jgi:hypothetical protein